MSLVNNDAGHDKGDGFESWNEVVEDGYYWDDGYDTSQAACENRQPECDIDGYWTSFPGCV